MSGLSLKRLGHRELCDRRTSHMPWQCHRDFEVSVAAIVLSALESLRDETAATDQSP